MYRVTRPFTSTAHGNLDVEADQASRNGSADTYETKPLTRSPVTPVSGQSIRRGSSTDVMASGGTDTQRKPKKKASNAGRKTGKLPRGTS